MNSHLGSPLAGPLLPPPANYRLIKVKQLPGTTSSPNLITNLSDSQRFPLPGFYDLGDKGIYLWHLRHQNKVGGFDPCAPKQEQHLGTHVWSLRASVEFAVDATRVGISALSALSSGVPQVPQFQAMFAAGP